ncbi:MAG TPA: RNA methyltransferase substrate-binding domain-containing protein, partial [Candidatus Baltobacteraceae bacterium]|nr:RNA methyltransferase substrate-binding domain-containing protein [Candidatus Baltobacteraceae bacterium]
MPTRAGAHADRVQRARELLATKGRRDQMRYAFEGPTLLDEALASKVEIEELFVLERVFEAHPILSELEAGGTNVFLVDERTAAKLSDLQTPTGLVATTGIRYATLPEILARPLSLVLADINDPGNAGTLLRSAEAFGATGVIFGR